MRLFIVRPFGIKKVLKQDKASAPSAPEDFDFEAVETNLIKPALDQLQISGGTTGEIFEPGDIRQDMFSLLLTADVVIADITIHNANVYYELGIRHALRDKQTILIKCPGYSETPFDILGYRYVSYKKDAPEEALPQLIKALEQSKLSTKKDSPVFNMLPLLQAQETEHFFAVPPDFSEEVAKAKKSRQLGKLALLAWETNGYDWQIPALRIIGEAQYCLKDFEDARTSWEKVKASCPTDYEANDRLATIYQRLAEKELPKNPTYGWELMADSDLAIEQLLHHAKINKEKKGEVHALLGRNAKMRWLDTWKKAPATNWKQEALTSPFLKDAFKAYEKGFTEDLNHFYSGINALGLLTVMVILAQELPDTWALEYETEKDATAALELLKTQKDKLTILVEASIYAQRKRLELEAKEDPWLNITEADFACLTSNRPQRVANLYQKIIQEATDLNFESAKRQLLIYEQLNVLTNNVQAALQAFNNVALNNEDHTRHYLLFTGHMIDKPDRDTPRFPPGKEVAVKQAIKDAVLKATEKVTAPIVGIAGGACGGDIVFHEVCAELNIITQLFLALPRDEYVQESVQFAGPQWVDRFDALYNNIERKELAKHKELPLWLQKKVDYTIWERNNLWMLYSALVCGGTYMTLIALWDGNAGDGPGGTEHMIQQAQSRGGKVLVIDITKY